MIEEDPIIDEVRRIKREIAAEFNYDVHALGEHLRQLQRESGRTYVTLPPRRVEQDSTKPSVSPSDAETPSETGRTVQS